MKTFVVGMKKNRALHLLGESMDVTDDGLLLISRYDEELDWRLVGLFKEWDCCVEADAVTLAVHPETDD